jgi:hypothetical protein
MPPKVICPIVRGVALTQHTPTNKMAPNNRIGCGSQILTVEISLDTVENRAMVVEIYTQ